jgi:hypothetical protein
MKLLATFGLAAAAALAQGPAASVQILAPSFRLIAGEQMALRAVVRDANGVERTADIPQWTVDNASLASVGASNGEFQARTLGIVRVTARAGSITNSIFIQVLPKRVVIAPATATVTVGQQMQFRAQALDRNDQPLPNIVFRWFASSGNGFNTNTAAVDRNGVLNTTAVGNILVRASFDYATSVPGFERQAQAVSEVAIRPPKAYELRKLVSTGVMLPGPLRLRARIVPLLGNDRGEVVFNAAFDGVANGPLMLDGAEQRLLAYGGMPGPIPQTTINDFTNMALNNRGEVLAQTSVLFSPTIVYKLTRDSMAPIFVDGTPLPGTEVLSGTFLNRNSLSDSGDWVFRANYRVANQGPTFTGLFRVPERGFPDEVISTRSGLPGITAPFTIDNDFGIAGNGLLYFTATSAGRRFLFVQNYDGAARKVLATGDPLLNSTVSAFLGNGFFVNHDGDFVVAVRLQNNELHLLRYAAGEWNAPRRNVRLTGFTNLFAVNKNAGTLFLGNAGRGQGLYLWADGDPRPVFLQNNTRLRDKPVPVIDSAALSGSGEVTILARTEDSPMEIFSVREGSEPVGLLQAGDPIAVQARVNIIGLLQGDRTGAAHFLAGGAASSVIEASESGLRPVMMIGERLTGVQLFGGANTSNSRKNPGGDVLLSQTSGLGILRVSGANAEFVLRPGFPLEDGAIVNAPGNVFPNSRGDLLWQASTNRGDTRLVLTRDGQHTTLLTNSANAQAQTEIDGKIVSGFGNLMIDEAGRAMASVLFRDGTVGFYLWRDGEWRKVAAAGETRHDGALVATISQIRSGGDSFYAIFNLQSIGNTLVRYRNDRWETVFGVTEVVVTGHQANNISNYDVNRSGDIFAQLSTNTQVLVVKRAGKTHFVHMQNEMTPQGDLLLRTSDFDIRDDGTLYFLGMTVLDEYVLYMAKPVN